VLASRLGVEAVESLLKGDVNCMIGVVNDKLVHTDFETAINNKKNTLKDEVRLAQILSI
jgi:6-phosphofructokinase 1